MYMTEIDVGEDQTSIFYPSCPLMLPSLLWNWLWKERDHDDSRGFKAFNDKNGRSTFSSIPVYSVGKIPYDSSCSIDELHSHLWKVSGVSSFFIESIFTYFPWKWQYSYEYPSTQTSCCISPLFIFTLLGTSSYRSSLLRKELFFSTFPFEILEWALPRDLRRQHFYDLLCMKYTNLALDRIANTRDTRTMMNVVNAIRSPQQVYHEQSP